VEKIVGRMNALNDVIAADSKSLGRVPDRPRYFCPPKGVTPDEEWYRRVIETEIVPLIEEYWFDSEAK